MPHKYKSLLWEESTFNPVSVYQPIREQIGLSLRHIEKNLWLIDTLNALNKFFSAKLFLKGGTCVQSYLPLNMQRFSDDLDFNIGIHDPELLKNMIGDINTKLKEFKKADDIYGKFIFRSTDTKIGYTTFYRIVPTKLGLKLHLKEMREIIPGETIKVQINFKHEIPAFKSIEKEYCSFIYLSPDLKEKVKFTHLSPEDLIADKILATAKYEEIGFGRERFKDVFDIGMLLKYHDVDFNMVYRKLEYISDKSNIQVERLIEASINNQKKMKNKLVLSLAGFNALLCRNVRFNEDSWLNFCDKSIEKIKSLLK
ncbi:MAG: hypothetical protein CVT88_03415 [Candidatus Altiarchaeales archaeon HGW-Altiarchaeales-1]|nr:MAG: hypothetical protein CVT88_03415 [Candidatus Altiarchaeales archaeon HGW-Altiarchaeales-1]